MNSLADVHFEMNIRMTRAAPLAASAGLDRQGSRYETEREQLARIAFASRSQNANESQIRRMAIWLSDFVTGLRCRLESHLTSETTASPC